MAAVSFAGTKSSSSSDKDLSDLYYVVGPPCNTGHRTYPPQVNDGFVPPTLRSRRLLPSPSEQQMSHWVQYITTGTIHNRSVKQTAVATSSTHAEARAILTLAKELNFLIALCYHHGRQ